MNSQPEHPVTAAAPAYTEQRIQTLLERIAHTGRLETIPVTIPSTDVTVIVTRPTDTDLLLDQAVDDPEQNLPYWSEIWPSGVALAADIIQNPSRIAGLRVLELGSGVGITAAIAVQVTRELTVTDYAEESLALTRLTTLRHTGREPDHARKINWRGDDLHDLVADGPFDVVLAADVLYERRDIEPLIAAMDILLKPDGALWLAEPGRDPARDFLQGLRERGWTAESRAWEGPWPAPKDSRFIVHTHWMHRS